MNNMHCWLKRCDWVKPTNTYKQEVNRSHDVYTATPFLIIVDYDVLDEEASEEAEDACGHHVADYSTCNVNHRPHHRSQNHLVKQTTPAVLTKACSTLPTTPL